MALFGIHTKLTDALICEALDPVRVAYTKGSIGGTAPAEVNRQLTLIEAALLKDEALLADRKAQVAKAASLLSDEEEKILA